MFKTKPSGFKTPECFYDKVHLFPVTDLEDNSTEQKSINISIKSLHHDLLIQLKDVDSYSFNYKTSIDLNAFHTIRREQNLDIEFDELTTHLLEMLAMNLERKLYLKASLSDHRAKCRLIFFEKSKIKSLELLCVELSATNQQELFNEMEENVRNLQTVNESLDRQITFLREKLTRREEELIKHAAFSKELKRKFLEDLKKIGVAFEIGLKKYESLLDQRLTELSGRISRNASDLSTARTETGARRASAARLRRDLDDLRLENAERRSACDQLRLSCSSLERANGELAREIAALGETIKQKDRRLEEARAKIDEYRADLESSAIALAKKTELLDELRKDLEQANQVIRNFNQHYDMKAEEVEELKEVIKGKDELIKEQIFQNNQLFKEYHEYQLQYNQEETDKLLVELSMAKNKIETLEKEKREITKMNGLLTKKLSSAAMFGDERH